MLRRKRRGETPGGRQYVADEAIGPRLTNLDRALYGLGQMTEGIKNIALAVFIMFYYNNLLGLDPMLAGTSMLIALIVDSVSDPLIGAMSDRWRSRWGRRHPFMYASIIPLVVLFYLLFSPPPGLSQFDLFLWLTAFGILARLALTFYVVPHLAMGAELSRDYHARTQLVAWRQGANSLGCVATYALAFMVFFPVTQRDPEAYPAYALCLSLIMGAAMLISALGTHRLIPQLIQPTKPVVRATPWHILAETVHALGNRNFRWYFSGALMIYMIIGVDTALLLYLNSYLWQIEGQALTWITCGLFVGFLLGAPFTRLLQARFDKRAVLIGSTLLIGFFQALPVVCWLMGWMPTAASIALITTLSVMRVTQGLTTVHANVTGGSMLADVADEYELQTGQRREGVFFGAQLITYKATSGLGKFVAGIALSLIAWPTAAEIKATGGVAGADKLYWLAMIYGPFMSLFAVLAVLCYSQYRLDAAEHARILDALGVKRRAAADAAAPAAAPTGPVASSPA
jgi:GPH family glycoside/pentoside/hexuronide:cation symporter